MQVSVAVPWVRRSCRPVFRHGNRRSATWILPVLLGLLLHSPLSAESLKGRVLDRASLGEPKAKGLAAAKLVLFDTTGRRLAAKSASKAGAYRFQGLKPGRYVMAVEKPGCFPSPLVRVLEIGPGDTAARDFALDLAPRRNHVLAREAGRKRTAPHGYYTRLAEGMLAPAGHPALFREAGRPVSLGRFFDAEDTTESWRRLWSALLWAEFESQERPAEQRIYLAHALDSALKAASWPALAALDTYLKVNPDSLEAYAARSRSIILAPSRKNPLEGLKTSAVPKALVFRVLDGHLQSAAIPLPKKRAFLAKAKSVLGPDASKRLAAALDAREREKKAKSKAKGRGPKAGPEAPSFDSQALWKIVREAAGGKRPNPAAQYHVGYLDLEAGRPVEALTSLQKANAARPGFARALEAQARAQMALGDSALAEKDFEALAALESTEWQARGWLGLARIQWTTGRSEAAEASLVKSLGLDDRSDSARAALMLLAEVSLERNSFSTVAPMLADLLEERPREAEAHYWLGRMSLKGKKDPEALEHFRQARSLAPARIAFAVAEAEVRFAREECGEALKVLRPLKVKLGPDGLAVYGQCLLALGRAKDAAAEFERMHKAKPSAAALTLWARALNADGRPEVSAALLAESPFNSSPAVRLVRAETHLALGQLNEARDALEPLRARNPEDPRLHFLLGRAFFMERSYADASKELTEAIQYRSDYPEAVQLQGSALLKLGRGAEAQHYFGLLEASGSRSWKAKGLCGKGEAFAQDGKLEEASDHLARSFQESPTAEAAAHMALVLLRLTKTAEASTWAAKARRLDPREPLGLMASVDVLMAEKREEEALALAQAGLEGNPASCDFQMVAAKVSLKAGKDQEARDLSEKAARTCPGEPAPHYYLGSLSARAGVKAEAKRHFGAYMAAGGDAKRVPAGYR